MRKLYFAVPFLFSTLNTSAQELRWQKDIQSSTQDFLTQVSITIDGQYLVSGSSIQSNQLSTNGSQQNYGYDFHLLKLNQQGNTVWEKYFSGNRHDYLATSAPTQEGGFILAGTSFSMAGIDKAENSVGGSDMWIIKINEDGNEEWQKNIGSSQNEEAKQVIQAADQGYFMAGDVLNSKEGFGGKDAIVIKMDKDGKIESQTIIGGMGLEEVEKMIATPDGGVLVGIYSRSGNNYSSIGSSTSTGAPTPMYNNRISKENENYGEGDYWIVKLNKNGMLQWQKNFGGKNDDRIKALSYFDGGYLVGGESRSSSSGNKQPAVKEGTDLWFVGLNENGDELWQKSYTFGNRDVLMSQSTVNDVTGKKTKGFLMGGYTQAEQKFENGDETFWMLYLDSKGDEVWRKHVEGKSKQRQERLVDAKLQNDGSFILAGTSAPELGEENWKIVKLGDKDLDDLIEKRDIMVYPNPVGDFCYVEIGFEFKGEAEIILVDMAGRQVQKFKTVNKVMKINTAGLPQGVYVVGAVAGNRNANVKIVKK